jgi:hypothetical protein
VKKGVSINAGLTTRIGSHIFFIAGQQNYAHSSVPGRTAKGLQGLNEAKADLRSHPDHKAEIITYIAAVKSKAIPQHGKERSQGSEEVSLLKMAGAIGLKAASSMHRHLVQAKLIKYKRRAYSPSKFESVAPEGMEFNGAYYRLPKLKDLQRMKLPVKFRSQLSGRHYYHSPAWLRHPLAGIPKTPLIVMEYLCSRGLLQMRHGKMAFEIPISLGQISQGVSLHAETVRRAIAYWEGKVAYKPFDVSGRELIAPLLSQILRFVRGKREKYIRSDGSVGYRRRPSKVVYVADKKFTHQLAAEEMERFITAAQGLSDPAWRAKAEGIHTALLRAWIDTERHLQTLWRESRKQMAEAGIPRHILDTLIPERPPP